MSVQTISLCMIVKNENSPHLFECLDSVSPHIDYYVICDTGSTDGTQEAIRSYFEEKGIPGEIHDIPWEGFGICRSKALSLCDGKSDYAWVIDADDRVVGEFVKPDIDSFDCFSLYYRRGEFGWWRNQIFKTGIGWKYTGVLHEYAECTTNKNPKIAKIQGSYYIDARTLGARNIDENKNPIDFKEKYLRDAETILSALTDETNPNYDPENARYHFYLAQSYFDAGEFQKSIEWYEKRAKMGGWEEEVFYSLYRIGVATAAVGGNVSNLSQLFLEAWNYRPIRVEPLIQLSRMYRSSNRPRIAYLYAKAAADLPKRINDILFIPESMYAWEIDDEVASTAFYAGKLEEGYEAAKRLTTNPSVPEKHRNRIHSNFTHYERILNDYKKSLEEQEKVLREQRERLEKEDAERRASYREAQKKKIKSSKRKAKSR